MKGRSKCSLFERLSSFSGFIKQLVSGGMKGTFLMREIVWWFYLLFPFYRCIGAKRNKIICIWAEMTNNYLLDLRNNIKERNAHKKYYPYLFVQI